MIRSGGGEHSARQVILGAQAQHFRVVRSKHDSELLGHLFDGSSLGSWVDSDNCNDDHEAHVTNATSKVLRGLKVAFVTVWDETVGKYIPNMDGRMTVECTKWLAAEDVTHVDGIKAFF